MKRILAALAALVLFAVAAPAQSGTIIVHFAMTNSVTPIDIPPPGPGMTRLRIVLDHTFQQEVWTETDEAVSDGAIYGFSTAFKNGWSLRAGSQTWCCNRSAWSTQAAGECVPFDGGYDGLGLSGATYGPQIIYNHADVTLPIPTQPFVLRSDARTETSVNVQTPVPGFGSLTVATRSYAAAMVFYQYLP